MKQLVSGRVLFASLVFFALPVADAADAPPAWSTYRGNPERTGNGDGVAGPDKPTVLWAVKSPEGTVDNYIGSPVPFGGHVYVPSLGTFNVSTLYCLSADPGATRRIAWSKSAPYLKLPIVSSPAVSGDKLVFGDGMHQTDGATLHCLRLRGGLPLWQLPVPGTLVHLEGSPTIVDKRIYIGGGAAGVLCVDLEQVTLDGKEQDLATMEKELELKWQALLAQYEVEKKKDPDLAVPPSQDQLPKPAPRLLWQQGREKWHVDAPVAAIGDRVLVASSYLDQEKRAEYRGVRALYCLDANTGAIRWQVPLRFNPWGGPSVIGDTVVVSGSNIGYDTKVLKQARGEVAAFDLADGKEKWRKPVPAGIVSCAALSGGLALASATDGKLRAFDLATGERRWIYDGKAPFFAPPATVAGVAYMGDLKGIVHAVSLSDGKARWILDLAGDPAVKAPGMIYGGPVVAGGRLFVATCNHEGPHANQPTAVVCIGAK